MKEQTKNFSTLQGISDDDLASRGIVRMLPAIYLNADSIRSFRIEPEGGLFVHTGDGENHIDPGDEADRVLGMILAARGLPIPVVRTPDSSAKNKQPSPAAA